MFAGLKRRLGLVEVSTTPTYIVVEGVSTLSLLKDMYRMWGNNTISKHMFAGIKTSELKMRHFFGLDFKYICKTLYEDKQTRTPKRVLAKIIEELDEKTWLGQIDKGVESITDLSIIDKLVPFPLKPFQREFTEIFGKMVPAYRLRGYMLDAGAGTGKTVTDLIVGEALHANKVIIVTPKNAAERVWEETIKEIMLKKRTYWLSTDTRPPSLDDHYYICHYEQLEQMLNFVKANAREFKNTFVILDESHNFNRQASDRTKFFIELCRLPQVSYNLWASGTPIQALGSECIPFLKCIDPLFDEVCEEAFRKIYGRDAKRANDILRNRIGHLKYHVPKQDVVKTEVVVEQVMVKMPDAEQYTLENIGKQLRKFIDERNDWYSKNKKYYEDKYQEGLKVFEKTLRNDNDRRQLAAYKSAVKIVSSGFDPRTMKAEAQLCNQYELKTIMPVLQGSLKAEFKSARSVVKYVHLKIMGEALGTVVGGMRSKCHVDMVAHIDFAKYIDQAKKKTLIFTSYVEVLETVADRLFRDEYTPGRVYGATNKDLSDIIAKFYKDEDLNPLCATYQSLSTAVPLTAANTILMINQPFRDAIRTQTIARAARLGQDETVYVFDFLLDTGSQPNISTRSNDILQWSQNQVAQILGVENVDTETLSLESYQGDESFEVIDFISDAANLLADFVGIGKFLDSIGARSSKLANQGGQGWGNEAYSKEGLGMNIPRYLYHGSMYKQDELMPGFQRSGELVRWDGTESNEWLYATSDREDAIMLGISSAIEKNFKLDRYQWDKKIKKMTITSPDVITAHDVKKLQVFIYTLDGEERDGWMPNFNSQNGIDNEFKTQGTVDDGIIKVEAVDIYKVLANVRIDIVKSQVEYSVESFSNILKGIKNLFGDGREKAKADLPKQKWMNQKEVDSLENYLKEYFGNASWLAKQEFVESVPASGIVQPLSYDGKFPTSSPLTAVGQYIADYKSKASKYEGWLASMNSDVQKVHKKYESLIMAAIKADDSDKVEELTAEAVKEFAAIKVPMATMSPTKVIGSLEVYAAKDSKSPFNGVYIEARKQPLKAPDRLPALSKEEIGKAVGIIHDMLKMSENLEFWKRWLDFEDGSKFSDAIHEYDEMSYMDYYDQYYFQSVGQSVVDAFPSPREVAGDVILALMAWIDRSIK